MTKTMKNLPKKKKSKKIKRIITFFFLVSITWKEWERVSERERE